MLFPSEPFIACPRCKKETFGVLAIRDNLYDRRCAACDYPRGTDQSGTYWLPELNKRLIYLDQSVLSNFMKALDPSSRRKGNDSQWDKWKELFAQVDNLVKLQVITCPDSEVHRAESIVWKYGEKVKRIYELLSHGHTFRESKRIWFQEHRNFFEAFCEDRPIDCVKYDASQVISGEIHSWREKLLVTVNLSKNPLLLSMYENDKKEKHQLFSELFKKWQASKQHEFDHWFHIELSEAHRIAEKEFFGSLLQIAKMKFKNDDHSVGFVKKYFASEISYMTPNSRIESALFAILAKKASYGMSLKDEGVLNDFKSLAITLPYCDAVVVDRQTAGLLREIPKGTLNFRAQVFSIGELDKFSRYLSDIKDQITPEHLKKVHEVYGPEWGRPYLTVFEDTFE